MDRIRLFATDSDDCSHFFSSYRFVFSRLLLVRWPGQKHKSSTKHFDDQIPSVRTTHVAEHCFFSIRLSVCGVRAFISSSHNFIDGNSMNFLCVGVTSELSHFICVSKDAQCVVVVIATNRSVHCRSSVPIIIIINENKQQRQQWQCQERRRS